jgi:hypothetical protein
LGRLLLLKPRVLHLLVLQLARLQVAKPLEARVQVVRVQVARLQVARVEDEVVLVAANSPQPRWSNPPWSVQTLTKMVN